MDESLRTQVTFRIDLSSPTTTHSVHLFGSWDRFRTPLPLEQDYRVSRTLWKVVVQGLEMGAEYKYHFVINDRWSITDPLSREVKMDDGRRCSRVVVPTLKTGPSPPSSPKETGEAVGETAISPPGTVECSVFPDKEKAYEQPRDVPIPLPQHAPAPDVPIATTTTITTTAGQYQTNQYQKKNSFRERFKARHRKSVAGLFSPSPSPAPPEDGSETDYTAKRRKWSLSTRASFFRNSKDGLDCAASMHSTTSLVIPEVEPETRAPTPKPAPKPKATPKPSPIAIPSPQDLYDIAAYLRSDIPVSPSVSPLFYSPHSPRPPGTPNYNEPQRLRHSSSTLQPNGQSPSPDMTSPELDSSDDADAEEEVDIETPMDSPGLGILNPPPMQLPRYYNFDEIQGDGGGAWEGDALGGAAGGGVKPLGYLREEVAGEMKWRAEVTRDLGYLGGMVI